MSAAWVAGSVRARLLLERCAGVETVKQLAGAESLAEAVVGLSGTAYAPVAKSPETTLEEAQRVVAGCTALQLRVLAAWLPPEAKRLLRSLAAWFELVNIDDRLAYLAGGGLRPAFELGVLSRSGTPLRRPRAQTSFGGCCSAPAGATPVAPIRRTSTSRFGLPGRDEWRPRRLRPAHGQTAQPRS